MTENNKNNENIDIFKDSYNNDIFYSWVIFFGVVGIFGIFICNNICLSLLKKYKEYRINRGLLQNITFKEINSPECIICLEEYNNRDNIIKLECGHIYHKKCVEDWFKINSNCPNCRNSIHIIL